MSVKISIIVAVGRNNRAIGKTGGLLWHISDDLKRFKALTTGHSIIMGRKTFDSIGHALPNRTNIVITRNPDFKADGVVVAESLKDAIQKSLDYARDTNNKNSEVFIIGGGEIYLQALPLTDKLYLTFVESDAKGDVFFPDCSNDFTKEVFRQERFDEKTGLKYAWVDVERE